MAAEPRRLRVVHVMTVTTRSSAFGGRYRSCARMGVDPVMVCSPGVRAEEFQARFGVPVETVPMRRAISPLADLVVLVRLWRRFRGLRPHVVHAHTPKGGLLGTMAAWLARVPIRVYHVRGLPLESAAGGRAALLRAVERVSCGLAHRVLCVSGSVCQAVVRERLARAHKVRVPWNGTGNGVDDPERVEPGTRERVRTRLRIPDGARVILFVGRIVRDRGVQELAEAWRTLSAADPALHLVMVGPFEPQDPVDSATEELLRTHPRVHLAGLDWDMVPYYAAADVVPFPSWREGVPIDSWLRGPLRGWAESLLDERRLREDGFMDPAPVRRRWREHLSGRRSWQHHLSDVIIFQARLEAERAGAAGSAPGGVAHVG